MSYFNTEHPVVTFIDTTVFEYFNLTNHRKNRHDPRYYVGINTKTVVVVGNNLKLDFYFYQYLTNGYRPSFIEMHFKFCELVADSFIGPTLKRAFKNRTCPYPPGVYDLEDLSLAYVPKGFPFTKGRIIANLTYTERGSSRYVGHGYIDIELKVAKNKKPK
ncbi:unnamed protein product [Chrysodeixis includens]|uniref:Uncharacterized protein n=1 Tax=Chrysodeixis includens TaxID=689277 RepID=A0A9P0BQN9_CHRIL|nr:unnamed protein product [Chrysodeixis includens]